MAAGGIAFAAAMLVCTAPLRARQTMADAAALASATELYLMENRDCPTVEKLIEAKIVHPKKRLHDAWGHEFEIVCHGRNAAVRSAGSDGELETEDDLSVPDSSRTLKDRYR